MKIYVSGPISGYEHGNLPAFRAAQYALTALGHEAFVPHDCAPIEHEGPCPRGYAHPANTDYTHHTSTACFIRGDLKLLLDCDAIYLLGGWEYSVGARAEFEVAAISGFTVFYEFAQAVPRSRSHEVE